VFDKSWFDVYPTDVLHTPDVHPPTIDWECFYVDDLGADDPDYDPGTCEWCGTNTLRFLHHMRHKEWPLQLIVGCICAERLATGYDGRMRERELKRLATQRQQAKVDEARARERSAADASRRQLQEAQREAEAVARCRKEVQDMLARVQRDLDRQRLETPEETVQREREEAARTVVASHDDPKVCQLLDYLASLKSGWLNATRLRRATNQWIWCGTNGASLKRCVNFGLFQVDAVIYPSRYSHGTFCFIINVPDPAPIKDSGFCNWKQAAQGVYDALVNYVRTRTDDFRITYN
jgi:hypothetical protein